MIVLNSHQPFVRHSESEHTTEHSWLNEVITESYIPFIDKAEALLRDGLDGGITLSVSPCLLAMLADPIRQRWYVDYLEERIAFLEWQIERYKNHPEIVRLARMYHERFTRCYNLFVYVWHGQLIAALRKLQGAGALSIITTAATHAYLPVWKLYPEQVELQILAGIEYCQESLGRRPQGFWLPECGFFPGIDRILARNGIKFSFLDSHGILNGEPRPKYGTHAPVHTPHGLVLFARDRMSHEQVWLKDRGYPGDPVYMGIDSDIGYASNESDLVDFTYHRILPPTGIRYFRRCNSSRELYQPAEAYHRCLNHATHFVDKCRQYAHYLAEAMNIEPVIVAMFDTEHFGHWWHEGVVWLDLVIRKLACERDTLSLTTADRYLTCHPTHQVIEPSFSSWGYQGYSETWLMGKNAWIYPLIFQASDMLRRLVHENMPAGCQRWLALNQYIRELLLVQASDWAYMLWNESAQTYAEGRVHSHLQNMLAIQHQLEVNQLDVAWLESLTNQNRFLPHVDLLSMYMKILGRGPLE